jgi:hypothetical protein
MHNRGAVGVVAWDGGFAPRLMPLIFGHVASRALMR